MLPDHIDLLRTLAADGELGRTFREAPSEVRVQLTSAAYTIIWPVVYTRLTKGIERRRGHYGCAKSVNLLMDECLDRFYDDVEAAIDDLLKYDKSSIRDVEAWVASRLKVSTIDGYRRRRGHRGALQKPRVPVWLNTLLGGDPWLLELAREMLIWVGQEATAGLEVWPLDEWTVRRCQQVPGTVPGDCSAVRRDVETVRTAMRRREAWYEDYVERPLGRKRTRVVTVAEPAGDTTVDLAPLLLITRADVNDGHLADLADRALTDIHARLEDGELSDDAIIEIIDRLFGGDCVDASTGKFAGHDLDYAPHASPTHDNYVRLLIADQAKRNHIIAAVLQIVGESDSRKCA